MMQSNPVPPPRESTVTRPVHSRRTPVLTVRGFPPPEAGRWIRPHPGAGLPRLLVGPTPLRVMATCQPRCPARPRPVPGRTAPDTGPMVTHIDTPSRSCRPAGPVRLARRRVVSACQPRKRAEVGRRCPCPRLSRRPRWPEAGHPRLAGTTGQTRPPSPAPGRWSTSPHRCRRAGPARSRGPGGPYSLAPSRRRPATGLGRNRMDGTNWSHWGAGLGRNRTDGTNRSRPAGGSRVGLRGTRRGSSGGPPGADFVRTRTRPRRTRIANRALSVLPGRPSRSGPTSRSGPSRVIAPGAGRSISPPPSRRTSRRRPPRPGARRSRPSRRRWPTSTDRRRRPRCCRSVSLLSRMCRLGRS